MPEPREVELKLEVDGADAADLKARVLPKLGTGGETEPLVSVYYDTPDQVLRKNGMTLRLRVSRGRRVQTLKASDGFAAGLFDRSEWETEVEGEEPDLAALAGTPARNLLDKTKDALEPVFETVIDRTLWTVETERSRIELALDEGRVVARGKVASLTEIELELKQGTPADLFDLLRELSDVARLRIGVLAKSERGYRLGKKEKPAKAGPVPLHHGMSTAAAFQAIMHSCLRQFRLNEPLVVQRRDPEGLHQARVGMRRLRSALSLFRPVIADDRVGELKEKLRALSRKLGDARNLDVYLAHTARPEAEAADSSGAAGFLADLEIRRRTAYDAIEQALGSAETRRLMLDLLAWIEGGPWLTGEDPLQRALREEPVGRFAARTLEERRRKVKKKGRNLETLDPEARHRVRIAAKKLRYAADFFAGLAVRRKERDRHEAFIDAMEDLQQHLGDLNDITTGDALAQGIAMEAHGAAASPAAEAFAAGHLSGGQDARVQGLLQAASDAQRRVVGAERFWLRWPGRTDAQ